jgi:uncharacterized protein
MAGIRVALGRLAANHLDVYCACIQAKTADRFLTTEKHMDLALLLMSFAVGVLIGLTSMGGAALMAPFLILVLGVRPMTAVGTDLVYGAVTKIIAAVIHLRQGTVDLQITRRLAAGSLPGGLLGSMLAVTMPQMTENADRHLQRAIGILLVIVAVVVFTRLLVPIRPEHSPRFSKTLLSGRACVGWGAIVGFCVGLTSVGSGSLMAPFLLLIFPASPATAIGTDIAHAALLVSTTGLVHLAKGHVQWELIPILLAGSIPGVLLGSRLAIHLPAKLVRVALAVLLVTTGMRLM